MHRIWAANQPGSDGSVAVERGDNWLLLNRDAGSIGMIPLTRGEYVLLSALRERSALGDALQAAVEAEPGFDSLAALARASERGVLADFDIEWQKDDQ